MRFWQKIFLSTLLIFILFFDVSVLILTTYSYDFSSRRETDSAIREQSVILSSVQNSIANAEKVFEEAPYSRVRLTSILKPLTEYYQGQGVFLGLYEGESQIYANLPDFDQALLSIETGEYKNISDRTAGTTRHLFVTSRLPKYEHLTFVYARDITALNDYRTYIGQVFLFVSFAVCVLLGISVFLLLRRATRPLHTINTAAGEIAAGAYQKRVVGNRKDELGELGKIFNRMADSVESNIKRLEQSAEDKQQFIDNLSHEIKTPLTSILGYADYLQKANSSEEERARAAAHLYESAQRLGKLSEKLLDIAYVQNEKLEPTAVDAAALLAALENLMRPGLAERELRLETEAHIKSLSGDETLLLSMLCNLVENAARASGPGQIIAVSAYEEGGAVLAVCDAGCGIEQSEIEKLTDPFYRTDKSRSRTFGGVGLGLSIVAQIVRLHGAVMNIESKKGKGTTVKILFTTP